ncbi:lachesin-like [Schistocerca piceifrons]|uniref:lachesin-like n=1 Tax=Schistocerca piceifrons TaxID=274613 RepID=UPI001F5FE22E|nr:lachesin-like [Schistocerca piceifrons]
MRQYLMQGVNFPGYSWGTPSRDWRTPEPHGLPPPSFEPTDTSITALAGQTVYLPCRVAHLGDKVVSWIRSRDLHILTSGVLTYTSDSRFEVLHGSDPDSWTLRLVGVRHEDGGRYECQVNTDPKLSLPVHLHVREPNQNQGDSPYSSDTGWTWKPGTHTGAAESRILGPTEQVVREGSTVTFTCEAAALSTSSPGAAPLHWLHDGRLISLQAQRGGFSLETERGPTLVTSRLTVAGVTEADSGRYTCRPPGARPATVSLAVMLGEHTEAMQGAGSTSTAVRLWGQLTPALLGVAVSCWWRSWVSATAS